MGKKHRETRKIIKSKLLKIHNRCYGWRENEFGELVKKASKAEARRFFLRRYLARIAIEIELVDLIQKRAHEDIMKYEDSIVFGVIDETCYSLSQ
jgi:hypothetical protein